MANKKTIKASNDGYKPDAIDGDGDGFVQDGTEWERPVEPEPTEPIEIVHTPGTYTVQDGENIQTIAAKFLPAGMKRNDYAKKLHQLNGHFSSGQVIKLG